MQDFDQIYLANYQDVYSFVRAHLWNEEDAKEATQETFLAAHRKWDDIKTRDDLGVKRWLIQAANLCIKDWRRKNMPYISRVTCFGEEEEFFLAQAGKAEMDHGLDELFTPAISMEERAVLTAFYQEGRTTADIARRLSLTDDAVKKRLERGRKHLKRELDLLEKFL